jgi:predicted enzyme related to lactoylglutathione lyase
MATCSGISSIMLGVSDMSRAVAFYEGTLGRPVRFRAGDGLTFIDGGAVMIGLSAPLAKVRQPVAGAMEIVFAVDGVKPMWRTLQERGVAFIREPRPATPQGEWTATMTDPDGHYVTLFGPPGE